MLNRLRYLVELSNAHLIARRYFITNGFDGVLTMLGLLMGFRLSGETPVNIILGACVGAAVALFMSGLTSAYISESAEKEHELRELEKSMITSLEESAHAEAAKCMPWFIAIVNGLSPLGLSLIILFPIFLDRHILFEGVSPLDLSLGIALVLSFMLGVFLGRLSGRFWLWTGIRALLIALFTSLIILLLHQAIDMP